MHALAVTLPWTPACDLTKVASCSDTTGPGPWLQLFVVAAVIGIALTAWFLLRGYRDDGSRNVRQDEVHRDDDYRDDHRKP